MIWNKYFQISLEFEIQREMKRNSNFSHKVWVSADIQSIESKKRRKKTTPLGFESSSARASLACYHSNKATIKDIDKQIPPLFQIQRLQSREDYARLLQAISYCTSNSSTRDNTIAASSSRNSPTPSGNYNGLIHNIITHKSQVVLGM